MENSKMQSSGNEILIVEDNIADLKLLKDFLTSAQYRIRIAKNGELALRSVKKKKPDLFLIDMKLPSMNGVEVCLHLKANPDTADIPVIFISAYGDPEYKVKALKAGGVDYITKPFDPSVVLAQIDSHLKNYSLTRRLNSKSRKLEAEIQLHKKTEEALRASEENLRITLNSIGDAVIATDTDGFVTRMNPIAEQYTGWRIAEALGRPLTEIFNIIDAQTRTAIENPVTQVLCSAEAVDLANHTLLIDQSGMEYQIADSAAPIKDDDGKMAGVVLVFRDVTEEYRVREALKLNEERLSSIIENSTNIFYSHDTANQITFISPQVQSVLGYCVEEAKTQWTEFTSDHPINEFGLMSTMKAIETGEPQATHSLELVRKNGAKVWVEVREAPIVKDGNTIAIVGALADISERKKVEAELLESEMKFRNLIEQSNDAIFLLIKDKFVLINTRFEEMFGYSLEECQDECFNFKQLVAPQSAAIIENRYKREQKGEQTKPIYEFTAITKHGKEVECEASISYAEYEGDTATQGVIRDISERRQAERERKNLEKQLVHAQKLETVGTLVGGIAHDINNILMPIIGFSELANMKLDQNDPIQDYLNEIVKAAARAKDIIGQLLSFSRQVEQEKKPTALQPIIREAVKMLKPLIPVTISITLDIDPDCGRTMADSTQIHQVIVNMCTNAYHAMRASCGELTIRLESVDLDDSSCKRFLDLRPGIYNKLSIIDTGHGMDKATQNKIFDPFFTTKNVGEGTGLGLAVVHGIIKSFYGDIAVTSEKGVGTTFEILLPVINDDNLDVGELTETARMTKGNNEQILVVDDEESVRKLYRKFLPRLGYCPEIVSDGSEALEIFTSNPNQFDMIITDLTMPDLTGIDLAKAVRKVSKTIPTLLISGHYKSIHDNLMEGCGFSAVLQKPLNLNVLAKAIRDVFEASRMQI